MDSKRPASTPICEPDVWWGPDGIDALCWADGIPYEFDGGGE
jgi:hypothetical protein